MAEFPKAELNKRQKNLKSFQRELASLNESDLTPENIAVMTKDALKSLLLARFNEHKSDIHAALKHIKFRSNGALEDENETYQKINRSLAKMSKQERMLLSMGMQNQGEFSIESLGAIAHDTLTNKKVDEKIIRKLVGVVLKTTSAFKAAHEAAGGKYLKSLRDAKYIHQ